jgi:hypothetical protein
VRLEGLGKLKKKIHLIETRSRNLPADCNKKKKEGEGRKKHEVKN